MYLFFDRFAGWDGLMENNTEKEMQQLRSDYAELQAIITALGRGLPGVVFILDWDGTYLKVLAGQEEKLFAPAEVLVGKTLHQLLPRHVADGALENIRNTIRTGETNIFEYTLEVQAGFYRFEGRTIKLPTSGDGSGRVLWIAEDVTDRWQSKFQDDTNKSLLQAAVSSWNFEFWVIDRDGKYRLVNSAVIRRWGSIEGKIITDLDIPDELKKQWLELTERVLGGETVEEEFVSNGPEGPEYEYAVLLPIVQQGKITGATGISLNMTRHRKFSEELRRVQQLQSIGLVAGGIAHDFNNLLTAISGNIELVGLDLAPDNVARQYMEFACDAIQQARGLTGQLLTFAKGGTPIKEVVRVEEILEQTVKFALTGSNVQVQFETAEALPCVEADKNQLIQVFQNLAINANQAMEQGGCLTVALRMAGSELAYYALPDTGNYLYISFEDQGCGIKPEVLERIFEPYFTTRKEGTGLGLAVCYSIIREHNGYMYARSEFGKGAVFECFLPVTDKQFNRREPEMVKVHEGSGKILIMDDEEMVSSVLEAFLKRMGYRTAVAENGEKALELYKEAFEAGEKFDAVFLDLTVPGGMGGQECMQELKKMDPEACGIVISGYSTDAVMSEYRNYGFSGMVSKPFTMDQLSQALETVLKR